MFSRAYSGTVIGVDGHEVVVESHRSKGLPGLALIGLAKGAAREAVVRVKSAIIASEFQTGSYRWVVNLLPAELEKDGAALDLALAVSLLATAEVIPVEALKGRRFYGELSLGGGLEPVRGAVLMADLARRRGDSELIVPAVNMAEAAMIPGVVVRGAHTLREVVDYLAGTLELPQGEAKAPAALGLPHGCLSDVRGQARAKRALEVAAAGGHNVLLIGPPGSGKTMLARRFASLMPPLTADEAIAVTRIHSAAGLLQEGALVGARPFRSPHHTASDVALCGGGGSPRPGEITLAHGGVLFLDEFPEFSRRALESLREPLEGGEIHIARAARSIVFPARFLLVAAMNPCPCGRYLGDAGDPNRPKERVCLCNFEAIARYRSRISGPLLDRIDLHVLVDAVPYRDYAKAGSGDSSATVQARVATARQRQTLRWGREQLNSGMRDPQLRELVTSDPSILPRIEAAIEEYGLSTRAIGRVLKVARTIADLDGRVRVSRDDVEEAIGFRVLDRGIWRDASSAA